MFSKLTVKVSFQTLLQTLFKCCVLNRLDLLHTRQTLTKISYDLVFITCQ